MVSRLPHRVIRMFAWPAVLAALVTLAWSPGSTGVEVNGNRNWLAVGPLRLQPSELAKLAVILWCADLYARKEKLLGDWRHVLLPMAPGHGAGDRCWSCSERDLGTALVLFAIVLGMLWVVGAPARLFVLGSPLSACSRSGWRPPARSASSG